MNSAPEARMCTVYRGNDSAAETFAIPRSSDTGPSADEDAASRVPVHRIMNGDLICAGRDLETAAVVRLIVDRHIGCLPVIDERHRPIGVITKFDIVEQVLASTNEIGAGAPFPRALQPRCADELMMPLAITVPEHVSVAHASSLMIAEDTHHVIVVSATGEIVGVVSSRDVVKWLMQQNQS